MRTLRSSLSLDSTAENGTQHNSDAHDTALSGAASASVPNQSTASTSGTAAATSASHFPHATGWAGGVGSTLRRITAGKTNTNPAAWASAETTSTSVTEPVSSA